MLKYNLLLYVLSPFIFLRLLFYSFKTSGKLNFLFQKAIGRKSAKSYSIWIHAASVGEMKIAIKVSKKLRERGYEKILITSNTPSSKLIFQNNSVDGVDHRYLPVDFFFGTKRLVKSVASDILIIIETEIWPNLYYLCKKNHTKVITINARFSPPSGIAGLITKSVYKDAIRNIDHIYCKSKKDMNSFLKFTNEFFFAIT